MGGERLTVDRGKVVDITLRKNRRAVVERLLECDGIVGSSIFICMDAVGRGCPAQRDAPAIGSYTIINS